MLLDIEQKGYICESDIESFLMQIKEAEVDNLSEVSRELWRYMCCDTGYSRMLTSRSKTG